MCCGLLSVAVLQHSEQTKLREERVSFSSHCPVAVYYRGKTGQGPEAGTEAEPMAKCCLQAYSSGLGSDQHCPQWAGPSQVNQQPRPFLTDMTKASLIWAIGQLRQLFPGKCCLCQLDKTLTSTQSLARAVLECYLLGTLFSFSHETWSLECLVPSPAFCQCSVELCSSAEHL